MKRALLLCALASACGDDDPASSDAAMCTPVIAIALAPVGSMRVVNRDLEITGTVTVPADLVVRSIDLALWSQAEPKVFDIAAAFEAPDHWNAQVPLVKLLAPNHGAGDITVTARLVTNARQCEVVTGDKGITVAPPDAAVDAAAALDASRD